MDKCKLKKSEPCAVSLLNTKTLEEIWYPAVRVGSKELALTEDDSYLKPAGSYQEALDIATVKVAEMKARL